MDDREPIRASGGNTIDSLKERFFHFRITNLLMIILWWSLFGGLCGLIRRVDLRSQEWSEGAKTAIFSIVEFWFYTLLCVAIGATFGRQRGGFYVGFVIGTLAALTTAMVGFDSISR